MKISYYITCWSVGLESEPFGASSLSRRCSRLLSTIANPDQSLGEVMAKPNYDVRSSTQLKTQYRTWSGNVKLSHTMLPIWIWFVGFLIIFLGAVVLWFIWTYLEVGRNYFGFLPEPLQAPSFGAVLGILICLSIVGGITFG